MFETDFDNDPDPLESTADRIWTVSQVTGRIKSLLESDPALRKIEVRGEVTNLSTSRAGHVYFGLKDESGYLKCVAFKSSAMRLNVKPTDGREVIASGRINVWPAGGSYQLVVDQLQDVGFGALWLQFEETRRKLMKEGLFDEERKRPLPRFPRKIGLVTSRDGAALRDMIRVFNDRAPYIELILSPSLVQGENAPSGLINALDMLELWDETEVANGADGIDLIIIGRGGGSFEDLACFNDEALVRRILETRVPVMSAVGHEVDFTIIDFVSDLRAATPTQAAQLAAPSSDELLMEVAGFLASFRMDAEVKLDAFRTGVSNIVSRPVYRRPLDRMTNLRQNLDMFTERMTRAVLSQIRTLRHKLNTESGRLETLDPTAILLRGYSLAFNKKTGRLISATGQVSPGDPVDLTVSDGTINMVVEEEQGN